VPRDDRPTHGEADPRSPRPRRDVLPDLRDDRFSRVSSSPIRSGRRSPCAVPELVHWL
jgi:hypothetical protein